MKNNHVTTHETLFCATLYAISLYSEVHVRVYEFTKVIRHRSINTDIGVNDSRSDDGQGHAVIKCAAVVPYVGTSCVDPYRTGGTCPPPNIYEGGTSMVMSPQYFRSDVV